MTTQERLRMLVISQNFPRRNLEWAGQFILRQARFLRDFGIDSTFIVPRPWAPWPLYRLPRWRGYGPESQIVDVPDFEAHRVDFVRPPGALVNRYEGAMMRPRVVRVAAKLHRRAPFDLVLGVQMNSEAISAVAVGRKLRLPSAALAIGSDVMVLPDMVPGLQEKQARMLEALDLPLAVSAGIAQRLKAMAPKCREPYVVRLARDVADFHPAPNREAVRSAHGFARDDVVAVYTGRVEREKGMEDLLEVLPGLLESNPRLRFVFLGDGPVRGRLVDAGERVRSGAVLAPGRVDSTSVPGYLQASDLFVFPSHSEGLPQAVLEAMNCGLPVVATDVGGTSEAVIHETTGFLVPARDPASLADAVGRLTADADLRRRLGRGALEHVLREFDPSDHSARLAERLRALVAGHRS